MADPNETASAEIAESLATESNLPPLDSTDAPSDVRDNLDEEPDPSDPE
jgi:hypothetical protein